MCSNEDHAAKKSIWVKLVWTLTLKTEEGKRAEKFCRGWGCSNLCWPRGTEDEAFECRNLVGGDLRAMIQTGTVQNPTRVAACLEQSERKRSRKEGQGGSGQIAWGI